MPMAKQHSPAVIRGRYSFFCSSVPWARSDGAIWRSATHWAATGAPTAKSSSVTTNLSRNVRPWPPYSFGMVIPTQPRSASSLVKPSSHLVSHVSMLGVKRPSAIFSARNSRTSDLSCRISGDSCFMCTPNLLVIVITH